MLKLKFGLRFHRKFVIFEGAVNLTLIFINDVNIVHKNACVFSLINEKNRRLHLGFHQATLQLVMF